MKNCTNTVLAFGTNIGDMIKNLNDALNFVSERFSISAVSDVYLTRSLLQDDQPDYCNIAAAVTVDCTSEQLLDFLQSIEDKMGRSRGVKRYGERIIDIDIIDFGGIVFNSERLILPHKEMARRSFVLYPLSDICPEYTHPVSGKSVNELKNGLENELAIKKIAERSCFSF